MRTTEQKLKDLEAGCKQKRAQILKEAEVLEALGHGAIMEYNQPLVCFSDLWGTVGQVYFQPATISKDGKSPDYALLSYLLSAFPPAYQMVKVSDGCLSFRPDMGETWTEHGKEYECFGIIVEVQTFQKQEASFVWYAPINGELWKMSVTFPFHRTDVGVLDIVPKYVGSIVTSYERCNLRPYHNAQVVKWASGGPEYPNKFTLYWDRMTGSSLDFKKLVKEVK